MDTKTIPANELAPKNIGTRITFPFRDGSIDGEMRQLYALGDEGQDGVWLNVITSEAEIPDGMSGDKVGYSDQDLWMTEFELAADTPVTLCAK